MTKSCFWAAISVGFLGFLQSGEFTATPTYCSNHVISMSDISVDSRSNPQVVTITLRYSKTDQAGKSICIYLGRTGLKGACAVPLLLLLQYLHLLSVFSLKSEIQEVAQGAVFWSVEESKEGGMQLFQLHGNTTIFVKTCITLRVPNQPSFFVVYPATHYFYLPSST